ncbi:MAG: hypothetical protein ACOCVL_03685, partial [Candidatus Sumerlaeota bacterium]
MNNSKKVLLICAQKTSAKAGAKALEGLGVETTTARDLNEAVSFLKQSRYHLIAVESKVGKHSGVAFLSQARKRLPGMQRVLIETEPLQIDMHALVNDVAPAAVFSGELDAAKVAQLLEENGSNGDEQDESPEMADHKA